MIFTASLLGAQQKWDSVENKPASLLVVSLGKTLNGMSPSLRGRQMVWPSSLPPRLRCKEHSLLLSTYQFIIGKIENPSCSACRHSSQDTSHFILHCPATASLRRSLFGNALTLYDLWSRPLEVARILGLDGLPPCSHPSEGIKYSRRRLL